MRPDKEERRYATHSEDHPDPGGAVSMPSRSAAVCSPTADRIGLKRFPYVTAVMVTVLVAMAVLQVIEPAVHYFGVGVPTELVAYVLQPVGGGNSIAVCGLTGAVALAAWHRDTRLPRTIAPVLMIWVGALVATVPPLAIAAVVVTTVATGILIRYQRDHEPAMRSAALVVGAAGVLLTVLDNIHGVALIAGLLLAVITLRQSPDSVSSADSSVESDDGYRSPGGAPLRRSEPTTPTEGVRNG